MDQLQFFTYLVSSLIISLSVHEYAHAYAANYFGDPTAKIAGRLTLNPLAHIDPLGLMMVFIAHFGWGKPVPVNPYNLRNPRWHGLAVALAGPVSNFILALICGGLYQASYFLPELQMLFAFMVQINIVLMIFNLIPIPPLDGSKILIAILPPRNPQDLMNYLRYGPLLLLFVFIFIPEVIWRFIGPAVEAIQLFILLQS